MDERDPDPTGVVDTLAVHDLTGVVEVPGELDSRISAFVTRWHGQRTVMESELRALLGFVAARSARSCVLATRAFLSNQGRV